MPPCSLELSMIVKDAAAVLPRCLQSVAGLVDRIVIGDTGSTDDSVRIARSFGAEVLHLAWENDFAHARNAVLKHAQCEWVLVLDADEMLDARACNGMRRLLQQPSVFAYQSWIWNYVQQLDFRCGGQQAMMNPGDLEQARAYPAYVRSLNTRLFRRHPEIYFEHCVHESITSRLDAVGLRCEPADFVIHHFGYVEEQAAVRKKKDAGYYQLALQKVRSHPEHFQAQLDAGMGALDHAHDPAAALPYFLRVCAMKPGNATGWLYAGICHTRLGRYAEAKEDLSRAAVIDPANSLVHRSRGDACFHSADYAAARDAYALGLALGDAAPLSQAKLGAALVQLGEPAEGLRMLEDAIKREPFAGELYDILASTALLAGRYDRACSAAKQRLAMPGVTEFHVVLAATVHLHAQQHAEAAAILAAAATAFPQSAEIRRWIATSPSLPGDAKAHRSAHL